MKPLGHRSYGSIPHLPGSRTGPGDYHIHEGQAKICTVAPRDKHDVIYVQEKLDGSNVGVAKIDGKILPITRAGYLATSSQYEQHQLFAAWVSTHRFRFDELLAEGERVCGEWLAQAHGTRYDLPHAPFVAFDLMVGQFRRTYIESVKRLEALGFITPQLIGTGPMPISEMLFKISVSGHGAIDTVEGAVWRVERLGKVDFLAKYVRHEKEDGNYLPEKNGTGKPIWNTFKL